jgi:hypothetical protein
MKINTSDRALWTELTEDLAETLNGGSSYYYDKKDYHKKDYSYYSKKDYSYYPKQEYSYYPKKDYC